MKTMIGVIGGSGVYDVSGLEDATWKTVDTPWGNPSDQILTGRLSGVSMAFLPRHGRGHVHSPTTVPYRANIDALKRLGHRADINLRFTTKWIHFFSRRRKDQPAATLFQQAQI